MPEEKLKKRYTAEFKKMAVEAVRSEDISYREAEKRYGIGGHGMIEKWERIYVAEGLDGLKRERRGRANRASGTQKGRKPDLDKQENENLAAENLRLRAENEYLKNLQALVLEDERRQHKKRW